MRSLSAFLIFFPRETYKRYAKTLDQAFLPKLIPVVELYYTLFVDKAKHSHAEVSEDILEEQIEILLKSYVDTVTYVFGFFGHSHFHQH